MPVINGFCNPPLCWNTTYDVTNAGIIVIRPQDVPNKWHKGLKLPLNSFPALEAAFLATLNAGARLSCDKDCSCLRLNKKMLTINLPPQKVAPHPAGVTDIYMEGIVLTGWWGICLAKKWGIRVKIGDKWVPVEELPSSELVPSTPPPPGSGGKKKKKKKAKKKRRLKKVRR